MNISVVVCVKDGERWLADALDSIVTQDRPPDEVVIVDDGSSDASMAIVRDYDARVVEGPRRGVAAAHTAGMQAARGDAIGVLGQDDLYEPGALRALAEALERDAGAGLAAGRAELFTDHEAFSGLRSDRLGDAHATRIPESVLFRAAALRPLLPLAHDGAWDLDLFLRLDEAGARCAWVDAKICRKRLRPDSTIHRDAARQQAGLLAALHDSIARRRAEAPQ